MYLEHFGLRQYPFALTADTEFFLEYGEFKDALDVLKIALSTGEGFTKVTGEVGTGKTLLCRTLLGSLDDRFVTFHVPDPSASPAPLHVALAEELGVIECRASGHPRLLEAMHARLVSLHAEGKRAVLLVDEAQTLSDEGIESLRLLSNLETEKSKLLQLVLFGQPELDVRLHQDRLRPLRQRILFSHELKPLSAEALDVYLRHRLHVAGYRGVSPFGSRSLALLRRGSGGVPRLINVLAHKALLAAFGRGDTAVDVLHVRKAIADTEEACTRRRPSPPAVSSSGLFDLLSTRFGSIRA